jgi:hypothetical protein
MSISLSSLGRAVETAARQTAQDALRPAASRLRDDFATELNRRISTEMGPRGSERRARMEEVFRPFLNERGEFDVNKLATAEQADLRRLQKASEDFEAFFVKGLLSQLRQGGFGEPDSPMTGFARDQMDQSISQSVASGQGSIGIAKTVFVSMAQNLAMNAVGRSLSSRGVTPAPTSPRVDTQG